MTLCCFFLCVFVSVSSLSSSWYGVGAENGSVACQGNLGFLLYSGIGIEADMNKAIMWLTNAAEANREDAQLLLGAVAYDEYAKLKGDTPSAANDDNPKLKTAKHYFERVVENGNKMVRPQTQTWIAYFVL